MFCSQMTYVVIMTQYEAHTFWPSSPLKFEFVKFHALIIWPTYALTDSEA